MEEVKRLGNIYNEKARTGFVGNVWDKKGLCPTLTTMQGGGREPMIVEEIENDKKEKYRIRKLTPKECFRLMGFKDEEFEKAEKLNSNTQLYKQAGNSIVVDVAEELLCMIFDDKGRIWI